MKTILAVFGTRPEAIKLAPVLAELGRRDGVRAHVCVTAQHRELLDQVLAAFGIRPDYDLAVMRPDQRLPTLTARVLEGVATTIEVDRPDAVLVHGDTTTALAAALAAFYGRIPVGHVEAGLRTGKRYSPFPEEMNRRMLAVLATWHFAPTARAAAALHGEGVPKAAVYVTGNTVIDALLATLDRTDPPAWPFLATGRRLVLVTAHRRENLGRPLEAIFAALRQIVERNPDIEIAYPVHLNPAVQGPARRILGEHERIHLLPPQDYVTFIHLLARATLIITDSGGVQEEAAALGRPTLVIREDTERPEILELGTGCLVGTDPDRILVETERLIHAQPTHASLPRTATPFGDGHAAPRIVDILLRELVRED